MIIDGQDTDALPRTAMSWNNNNTLAYEEVTIPPTLGVYTGGVYRWTYTYDANGHLVSESGWVKQ